MEHRSLIAARWAAPAAAWWCIAFAGLHLYWALGGSTGLASSAGQDLASRRPATFVVFGLYGVALTLLAGAALIVLVSIPGPMHRRSAPTALVGVIGIGLLMRGVALEILLATDVAGLRARVGPLEARWSQVLWNPWFALGGALFIATALQLRRRPDQRQQVQ